MSHLDEGTLHALLDGELNISEVSEIQVHLGTCVACGSRLQEVRQVLAEADRLVGAVELPAGTNRGRSESPRSSASRPPREPEIWNQTPVLLVPESADALARRGRWMRALRWAAVIAVVVVGGRAISNALRPGHPMLPERDLTSTSRTTPPAVVSPEESRRPESLLVAARGKAPRPSNQNRAPVQKTAAKPEAPAQDRAADTAAGLADAVAPASEDTVAADTQLLAAQDSADTAKELAPAAEAVPDSAPVQQNRQGAAESQQDDERDVRGAAAAALAELDRERLRQRANAATAALPPGRPEAQPSAESAPTPAPPTLEQRAQVYLRIGLDEAAKQLGGPVHVIEGMTPQFIGLTRGQLVPGTNSTRPVVRVVYLDARGRMILLDQQRMRAGQVPSVAAGSLRWALDDVMLYLRGEPSPEVLRSLQARVR